MRLCKSLDSPILRGDGAGALGPAAPSRAGIAHRGIKPGNIFVFERRPLQVKRGDLSVVKLGGRNHSRCGAELYSCLFYGRE